MHLGLGHSKRLVLATSEYALAHYWARKHSAVGPWGRWPPCLVAGQHPGVMQRTVAACVEDLALITSVRH